MKFKQIQQRINNNCATNCEQKIWIIIKINRQQIKEQQETIHFKESNQYNNNEKE